MGQATFSNNTTMKASGGSSGGGSGSGSVTTASNEYAIISLFIAGTTSTVNGASYTGFNVWHLGPSSTLSWTASGTSANSVYTVARFVNTP